MKAKKAQAWRYGLLLAFLALLIYGIARTIGEVYRWATREKTWKELETKNKRKKTKGKR